MESERNAARVERIWSRIYAALERATGFRISLSTRSKLKEYADSPWTWGAIGILAGAILPNAKLYLAFAIAWIIFVFTLIRVKPFDLQTTWVRASLTATVSAAIGLLLWIGWRATPKPEPPAKFPTAAEIAAEVKKILPEATPTVMVPPRTAQPRGAKYEVSVIFKESPLLTPEVKTRISKGIDSFYLYLQKIGFSVEKDLPPIGVSPYNVQMMSGISPGSRYDAAIYLPRNSLGDVNAIRKVYASYFFRKLFRTFLAGNSMPPNFSNEETAATLYEVYYTSSFANLNLDSTEWRGRTWMETLWDIRSKKGQDFTDRALYYAYKTWDSQQMSGEFDSSFLTRFLAGVWVIDNNGASIESVDSILAAHHLR